MWESLLVVAGAFGATLLAIYINNVVMKPVLFIDEYSTEEIYDQRIKTRFYKLIVENKGLRAATNCTATLKIKDIRQQDVYKPTTEDTTSRAGSTLFSPDSFSSKPEDLNEESIPWDLGLMDTFNFDQPAKQAIYITINKQARARVSLFSISEVVVSGNHPVIFIEPQVMGYDRIALIANRKYEGEVKLTASNANPRVISFIIEQDTKAPVSFKISKVKPKTRGRFLRQTLWGQ